MEQQLLIDKITLYFQKQINLLIELMIDDTTTKEYVVNIETAHYKGLRKFIIQLIYFEILNDESAEQLHHNIDIINELFYMKIRQEENKKH